VVGDPRGDRPDALGAAIHALERAQWVFGPDAAAFLDRARRRVTG
jgi:hypothetical protein